MRKLHSIGTKVESFACLLTGRKRSLLDFRDSSQPMASFCLLPREVVESPSLEIFQTRLAAVLCSLLWVTLLQQGVGLGDPQRSLPTPNIL